MRHTMSTQWKAARMDNLARALHFMRTPFLHGRAIDVFSLVLWWSRSVTAGGTRVRGLRAYVKGHPADGLVLWNLRLFDQLQLQRLVVKRDRDDDTGRRPRADHEVVFDHVGGWFVLSLQQQPVRPQFGSCEEVGTAICLLPSRPLPIPGSAILSQGQASEANTEAGLWC